MKIAICDDDPKAVDTLTDFCNSYLNTKGLSNISITTFYDGKQLFNCNNKFDIVFLDIVMPKSNGIEITKSLKKQNPQVLIIIVTDYPDYLDDAMRNNVFRYIQRIAANLSDAIRIINSKDNKLVLSAKKGSDIVSYSDIIMLEYMSSTKIYTTKATYDFDAPFHIWADKLSDSVHHFRTHRNYIVNLKYVLNYTNSQIVLQYQDKTYNALLTKRKSNAFNNAVFNYIDSHY